MKWSLVKVVRNTLLALSIGAFLPSLASATSVTPTNDPSMRGVWILAPGSVDTLMKSPKLVGTIPFRDDGFHVYQGSDGKIGFVWFDADDDPGRSVTSTNTGTTRGSIPTSTPEPSTVGMLGLGLMGLGLAFGSRRLRPVAR